MNARIARVAGEAFDADQISTPCDCGCEYHGGECVYDLGPPRDTALLFKMIEQAKVAHAGFTEPVQRDPFGMVRP